MQEHTQPTSANRDGLRLYNLDYLRGLAAFGIMIYHYLSWGLGDFSADTFVRRVGIYGVSIFYVLSGLTLYFVYYDKMKPSADDLKAFFKKRILRIFPLLWLVTIAAILLSRSIPDFSDLFLNLSGLFGFIKWDTYFSIGVWSIGNELVFYVFFPFFILFAKSYKPLLVLLSIVLFSLYLYFAFVKLTPESDLTGQWRSYVNPLNQVFLFLGGFLMGLLFKNMRISNTRSFILLLIGVGTVVFIPTSERDIELVTGLNRLLFTSCCFLICFCFYKLTFRFPAFVHKPLTLLGEASYSVYLLHPLVWTVTKIGFAVVSDYTGTIPIAVELLLSAVVTLIISYFSYEYFEKFFMRLGRKPIAMQE